MKGALKKVGELKINSMEDFSKELKQVKQMGSSFRLRIWKIKL